MYLSRALAVTAILGAAGAARAQPSDVSVVPGDGQVTVSFTAAEASNYDLHMAAESGVSRATVDALPGGRTLENIAPPFTLRGLDNNRPYFLVIAEIGPSGTTGESAEARAVPRATWAPVLSGVAVAAVAADAEIDGLYLAAGVGTGDGCAAAAKVEGCDIYRSGDGGQSWEVVTQTVERIDVRALAIRGGIAIAGSINVGAGEKLLRSGNGGRSWELSGTGAAQAGETEKAVAIDPLAPMTFYAGHYDLGGGQSRVVKTENGGMAWLPLPAVTTGQAQALAVNPSDSLVVWLGSDGDPPLAQSLDGGMSFAPITNPGITQVEDIAFNSEMSSELWLAADGAVFVSDNGGTTFAARASGLPAGPVHALAHAAADDMLLVAAGAGLYHSVDGGETYARLGSGLEAEVLDVAYGPDRGAIAATADGLFRLDLTPPPPLPGPADAGLDAMGGDPGGGCGCASAGPGGGPLGALGLAVVLAFTRRRRRGPVSRGARRSRRRPRT